MLNYIDFLEEHWLDGEYKMLFNTLGGVDHQRRAFSHNSKRLDIYGTEAASPHADEFLKKVKDLKKEGECFSLPMTEEKLKDLYRHFSFVTQDLTKDPKWDALWARWQKEFMKAVAESPEDYMTPEQLKLYDENLRSEMFLGQFMYDHQSQIQNRVKSAYCFKMLSELLMNPKVDKDIRIDKGVCVILQTVANHYDHLTEKEMMHYLADGNEKKLKNKIKSSLESMTDPTVEINNDEDLQALIDREIKTVEGFVEYQQMDESRRSQLIQYLFTSESAKMRIQDAHDKRSYYKELQNIANEYLNKPEVIELANQDPQYGQTIRKFIEITKRTEMGKIDVAIDKDDFENNILTDRDKLAKLNARFDLEWAHEHMSRELDTIVQEYTHGLRDKDKIVEYYKKSSENDTVNGDTAAVRLMVEIYLDKLGPELDRLKQLRQAMEADLTNIENRNEYYQALDQIRVPSKDMDDLLNFAHLRNEWILKIRDYVGLHGNGFIENAEINLQVMGPPLDETKIKSILKEFDDLNNDMLLNYPEFNEAFNRTDIPQAWLEETKRVVLSLYRDKCIKACKFSNDPDEDMRFKAILENINELERKNLNPDMDLDGKAYHENFVANYTQKIKKQVEDIEASIKKSVTEGKTLQEAIALCQQEIDKLESSVGYQYIGTNKAEALIMPLKNLRNDYQNVYDLIQEELEIIAGGYVPKGGEDSGQVLQDLIDDRARIIENHEAFKRRPHVSAIALRRQIISDEARETIKEKAFEARTQYFSDRIQRESKSKDRPQVINHLIHDKHQGLKWVRNLPARRRVCAKLAENILKGDYGFPKRNAFQKFFGSDVTSDQQKAFKQLQNEYMSCIKIEMAQAATNKEALAILEAVKEDPVFAAVPKTNLFDKSDKTAQKALEALRGDLILAVRDDPDGAPKDLGKLKGWDTKEVDKKRESITEDITSPESDVQNLFHERIKRLSQHEPLLREASIASELEAQRKQKIRMLQDPNQHQILLDTIKQSSDNPKTRMEEIQALFEMARNNDNFPYHQEFHLSKKEYGPVQAKAMMMLQDAYMDCLKEQVFQNVWMCVEGFYDPDTHPFNAQELEYNADNMHPSCLPKTMDAKHKNQIYLDLIAPAKKTPILCCDVQKGRGIELATELSELNEMVNHIYDTNTPDFMVRDLDKQEKQRLEENGSRSRAKRN